MAFMAKVELELKVFCFLAWCLKHMNGPLVFISLTPRVCCNIPISEKRILILPTLLFKLGTEHFFKKT